MTTWRVPIAITAPLNMNARDHWAVKASKVRTIRESVAWMCRASRVPASSHVWVTLYYVPKVQRRRDADNLVATLKPACDGIVDAGVVEDDTPEFMTKAMPVVLDPDAACKQRVYLTISDHP